MKYKKICLFTILLISVSCSFGCFHNRADSIVISCNLKNEEGTHQKGSNKQFYSININTQISNFSSYKSINVYYPEIYCYGMIREHIVSSLESETEKPINNAVYEKSISVTFDSAGLSFQQIKETLDNQFIEIKLEDNNGREFMEKYPIGKLLKNKSTLK